MINDKISLVNIVMVTYNQENYIEQAIGSVLAQNCSFDYKLIISDDFSTDKTAIICRKYANLYPEKIIFLQNKNNLGLVHNYKRAFDICSAKYISLLEGDDYWTDENKLEKQVKLMESDENIGLVHASVRKFIQKKNIFVNSSKKEIEFLLRNQGSIYEELIKNNFIIPVTVLFRKQLFDQVIDYEYMINKNFKTIDFFTWVGLALNSKVCFIKDVVGVYRIHEKSISNDLNIAKKELFLESAKYTMEYYLKSNPINGFSLKEGIALINKIIFHASIRFGNFHKAKQYRTMVKIVSVKDAIYYFLSLNRIFVWIASKY